jgi:hypothetical protein
MLLSTSVTHPERKYFGRECTLESEYVEHAIKSAVKKTDSTTFFPNNTLRLKFIDSQIKKHKELVDKQEKL